MIKIQKIMLILLGITYLISYHVPVLAKRSQADIIDCSRNSIHRKWLDITIISNSDSEHQRSIELLLDKRSFAECSLRWVFQEVSKQFPQPYALQIIAKSDIGENETTKGPWAVYIREANGEAFRYKPNSSYRGVKKVIVKGIDPFKSEEK